MELTDKERILLNIIRRLYSTQLQTYQYINKSKKVYFDIDANPKAGDIVFAQTSGGSNVKIGIYVRPITDGAIIKEIGTGNSVHLYTYKNERFIPIYNLSKFDMLEGDQYKFYIKVLKAIAQKNINTHSLDSLDFDEGTVKIKFEHSNQNGIKIITMKWNKRTTIKAIIDNFDRWRIL